MKNSGLDLIIRPIGLDEAQKVSAMVEEVFHQFVAPDLEPEGVDEFLSHVTPAAMQTRMGEGDVILMAELDGELVGMADLRERKHLSLFFVKTSHHGQGIGKRLLEQVIGECRKENPDLEALTVNSSLGAQPVYLKLGFVQTDEEQLKNGIRFVPMRKDLHAGAA